MTKWLSRPQLIARLEEIFETFPVVTVTVKQIETAGGPRYLVEVS